VAGLQLRSVMCVPLTTPEGKAFGVLQLDTLDPARKFNDDDLRLLWGVANQAAVALENARLHEELLERVQLERDLEVAGQVQRSLLPEGLPDVAGYDFFAHYAAALTVGGDYYDFIPLPQQRLAVTLGDVAGKGVAAALLMAKLSSEMRTALLAEAEPAEAMARLNEALYPHTQRTHRFVTLTAAVLDPARQRVTVINAGHLPPLLYRRADDALHEAVPRDAAGTVLGMDRGLKFRPVAVDLRPGDCLLLFTDGVCEAVNGWQKYQLLDGIHAALRGGGPYGPRSLGERLVKAVEQHATRDNPVDDVAVVCFGRKA
jgi:serine phosphatase RsbU (regulator of sigma subunit)